MKPNPRYALTDVVDNILEPFTVKEALAYPSWLQAIQDELQALEANQTWELVPRTPQMNVIGTKWESEV